MTNNINIIKSEYPGYQFTTEYLYYNDSLIKAELGRTNYDSLYAIDFWSRNIPRDVSLAKTPLEPVKNMSVKCYKLKNEETSTYEYSVINFYPHPIEVIYACNNNGCDTVSYYLENFKDLHNPVVFNFHNSNELEYLRYRTSVMRNDYKIDVIDIPPPF